MPSIIYDFEEINKKMFGDDWLKPKQNMEPKPIQKEYCDERAGRPCYGQQPMAPAPPWTPPPPSSIEAADAAERQHQQQPRTAQAVPFALPAEASSQMIAIRNLLDIIKKQLAYESAQVELRMKQIHELKMPSRKTERLLQEEWERHLSCTAPMRQQCDWLVKQLNPLPLSFFEYECEVHEGTPLKSGRRSS